MFILNPESIVQMKTDIQEDSLHLMHTPNVFHVSNLVPLLFCNMTLVACVASDDPPVNFLCLTGLSKTTTILISIVN